MFLDLLQRIFVYDPKNRITAKGYGETRPLVVNAKTEEEFQRNRRTEFKVTKVAK